MKRKERKNFAIKIAECEKIIATSTDKSQIQQAEGMIMALSKRITSLEDMMAVDILVQELLEQKN